MTAFEKKMLMLEDKLIEKRAKQFMSNPEALNQFKIMVASSGRINDQKVLNKIVELEQIEQQRNTNIKTLKLKVI